MQPANCYQRDVCPISALEAVGLFCQTNVEDSSLFSRVVSDCNHLNFTDTKMNCNRQHGISS